MLFRGGPWYGWTSTTVYLYGSDAVSGVMSISNVSGTDDAVSGYSYAAPGTYQNGAAYFWMDEGAEFATTAIITAGAASGQTLVVDQEAAQRIWVSAPYWASGKPGTTIKIRHENFPGSWTLDYSGFADSPSATPFRSLGSLVTTGANPFTKSVRIPTGAPAGYWYILEPSHREGPLALDTPFQVCTLKPSKSSIRRGGTVS